MARVEQTGEGSALPAAHVPQALDLPADQELERGGLYRQAELPDVRLTCGVRRILRLCAST